MKRRHFVKLTGSLMAGWPFFGLSASTRKSLLTSFRQPVTREDWVALWAELVEGYVRVLSPGKVWGRIVPEGKRKQWKDAPSHLPGDPELVSRMMWSISAWFMHPDRPNKLRARHSSVNVKSLLIDTIANATKPTHPEYWDLRYAGPRTNHNQYSVEAPPMGIGALVARERFGHELPADFVRYCSGKCDRIQAGFIVDFSATV